MNDTCSMSTIKYMIFDDSTVPVPKSTTDDGATKNETAEDHNEPIEDTSVDISDIIQVQPSNTKSKSDKSESMTWSSFMIAFNVMGMIGLFLLLFICVFLLALEYKKSSSRMKQPEPITITSNQQESDSRSITLTELLVIEAGWYRASNGMLYKYFDKDRRTFASASNTCKGRGGRLASAGMRNATVRKEIILQVAGMNPYYSGAWIGLHDMSEEGLWMWSDGVTSSTNDVPWALGEPSNYSSFYSRHEEDCAAIIYMYYWRYNHAVVRDYSCKYIKSYICEIQELRLGN